MISPFILCVIIIISILWAILSPLAAYKNCIKTKMSYKKSLQRLKQQKNIGIISLIFVLGIIIFIICMSTALSMALLLLILPVSSLLSSIVSYILIKKYIKEYIPEEEKPEA